MQKEYQVSGFWKVNNYGNEYGGDLYVNQNKGTIALELHIPNQGAPLSTFAIPYAIDFITGNMVNGAKLTLINCNRYTTRSVYHVEEIFVYTARYLVNGYCFDRMDKIVFSKVAFRLSNLLEWGGISLYDMNFIKDYKFQLVAKYVEPTLLFSSENVKISYTLLSGGFSMETKKEELLFRQEPNIIIEATTDQPIEFFIEKLTEIKRIIEVAIGVKTDILNIKFETTEITRQIGENIHPKELELIHCYPQEESYQPLRNYNFLFKMQSLVDGANLTEWFRKYSLLEPILELYIEDLNSKELSVNRRFLNMVQALETYHSRMICNGNLSDYKKRIEKILQEVPAVNKKPREDLLLSGCSKEITLKGRMYDLLLAEFKIHFNTGDIKQSEFPQKIADTRNYLTHYNINKETKALKGQALVDCYVVLKRMLEYYLMKELGFDLKFIEKRIKEREKSFRIVREIRALDKKLKEEKQNE